MNVKRFIAAGAAVFVVMQVMNWLVHGLLLSGWYQELKGLWRADMMDLMWVMTMGSLFFSFMFVFIFIKGYEGKGLLEGARYGLLVGLLMEVSGILGQYAMYPVPFTLSMVWLVYGIAAMIIAGITAAVVYRKN